MTHAVHARKERGAKIAAVDIYMNGTMEQADLPVLVKPGTDGALACAVMHCLFRDGKADWEYLDRYTDVPRELEAHLRTRDPAWASRITGTPSRPSRNSPGWSASASAPSSGSATASRARATARRRCMRRAAFRR
jgi:anaerobic selenocysteine-containing dehydrogenase